MTARTWRFVELPVVGVGVIRQPGHQRQRSRAGIGAALDRHHVQRVGGRVDPLGRRALKHPLACSAELLEYGHATRGKASLSQNVRESGGAVAVADVGDETSPGLKNARDQLWTASDRAEQGHLGGGPEKARAGEREGGGMWVDDQLLRVHAPGERRADSVQHRIAACKDAGTLGAATRDDLSQQRLDRRRPHATRGDLGGQRLELAARADYLRSASDRRPRALTKTRPAVCADAHDGDAHSVLH